MILSEDFRKNESFDFDSNQNQMILSEDFRKNESFDSDFIFKDFKKLFNLCSSAPTEVVLYSDFMLKI